MNEINMLTRHEDFIDGIIHIGANIGQEIQYYNSLDVPILYFEPLEEVYNKLIKNIASSKKIKAERLAIGSEDKEIEIYESTKEGVSSSILEPEDHLKIFPDRKFTKNICKQVTLDTYFLTNPMIYNVLVADIQGYEYFALQGAKNLLEDIDLILLEVWYKPLYKNTPLKDEIDKFLWNKNFTNISNIPVNEYFGNSLYEKIEKL